MTFFADPPPGLLRRHEAVDGDHGRIEIPRHAVCHQVTWLSSERRHPDEIVFPDLTTIAMVESETERHGKVELERRYHLSSAKLDPEIFALGARPLGARTGCTGSWTWCSATTSPGCGAGTAPRTWRWSSAWP